MKAITLPKRSRGRQTATAQAFYDEDLQAFCAAILEIKSTLDFAVSSRGWCYILEEHGLAKGDFDRAQSLINTCRKSGAPPLDICAEDGAREFDNLERWIDTTSPEDEARYIVDSIKSRHLHYAPFSFWEHWDVYVQMLVEKIDLKSLFGRICAQFHVPIANA